MRHRGASLRRVDIERRQWRRRCWQRTAVVVVVVLLVGSGGWFTSEMLEPGRIPLRKIHVSGIDQQRQSELEPLFAAYWGQNYFTLDLESLRDRLLTNPWLVDVSIHRSWPNELRIIASQREVFSYWADNELLDRQGHRFRPARLPQRADWPRLSGPVGQEQVLIDAYQRASAVIAPLGLKIAVLQQNDRLEWRLQLAGGVTLALGRDDLGTGALLSQLNRFARVYPLTLKPRFAEIEAIDMRYNNGFSVRWAAAAIRAKAV